jgi:CelD/BcsL family acetyltransferase involved in cellulose biosynthesis
LVNNQQSLTLDLITSADAFEALGTEWNTLLPHNATNEIFLTWEWQSTWWFVYPPGDLWVVAARDQSGQLVGIAPWFIEQPTRVVRTIGCVEVTDYLDVLVMPELRDVFYNSLVAFFGENCSTFSKLDLCNIPGESPTLEALPRLLKERGYSVQVKHEDVCPFIPLPADYESYLEQLDKKQRHELRRKLRRAEAEDEGVGWYVVGPEHDLSAEIDRFISLMAASHPNKAKFLAESHHKAFFKALMPRLAACGWLQLSFLTVNGEAAAAYLNFDYNNRILVYNSGLLPASYAHLSPGIVLLIYNIQHAISQGRAVFDFLQGNEEYKYRMGAQDRTVMMLEADLPRAS